MAALLVCVPPVLAEGPAATGTARSGTVLPPAKPGFSYPECYCTDTAGRRVELGQRVCLRVDGRERLALCAMSQNNPIWRFSGEGCPVS